MKLLATPAPANTIPDPKPDPMTHAMTKRHHLPVLKPQDVFDPPAPNPVQSNRLKLALGLVAFAAMAGLPLMDWSNRQPVTTLIQPSPPQDQPVQTVLPNPDEVTRTADGRAIVPPAPDMVPSVLAPNADPPVVDVLQVPPRLEQPKP